MVRIHQRADVLDLIHNGTIRFPYRQQDLADALGLSLVHTNKTLAKLRERQLASWSNGELRLAELTELSNIAHVDLEPLKVRPLM